VAELIINTEVNSDVLTNLMLEWKKQAMDNWMARE